MADTAYRIALAGQSVEQSFYGDVATVTVTESTTAATSLNLRLTIRLQDDGTWTYLDDDRLALFAPISVAVGFAAGGGLAGALSGAVSALTGGGSGGGNDGLVRVLAGYVTDLAMTLGSEPGSAFLDVSAMDTSVLLSLEEKIATWPDMADSDIAQQILSGYGVQVRADTTPTVHQEDDAPTVQRGSDLQFLRALARRNGFELYFEPAPSDGTVTAYFRLPQLDGAPQSDLAIQFGDQSNLRNFAVHVSGQRPLSVKTAQIDVKANGANTEQISDTQLRKLGQTDLPGLIGGALDALVTPADAQAEMLVLGPPSGDATDLRTVAQAVRDESAWFLSASGEINSTAYQAVLRPRRLVLVKGAGKRYSGAYYVTSVVHEVRGDGTYKQTFEARRNARDLDGSEQFGASSLGLPLPGL